MACSRGRLVLLLLVPLLLGAAPVRVIDDFEQGLSSCWQPKVFQGATDYRVIEDARQGKVLQAEARGTASGLVCEVPFDPNETPILSWRWKIEAVHPKGDARSRAGDDYPARIYVVFPHWFPPLTRALNYIWANRLPQGTFLPSLYTERSVMIAVESGNDKSGRWLEEERDIVADYRRAFGEDPPEVGAVAIMTDGDNTGGRVRAWYDAIVFKSRKK
ncbi:MAG: DUF3047 domain-containing protein [Alphaproteobacteria bacterium]|nr:MAG: DUF3047 domain-containing protein [Alphaproteobacteria bacterium]